MYFLYGNGKCVGHARNQQGALLPVAKFPTRTLALYAVHELNGWPPPNFRELIDAAVRRSA